MDERLLKRLAEPDCYPGTPDSVEIRQTHISVVCLAGDSAYKLKKPVHFSFLDFSTPKLREHFCREEVRLNRRLCPDWYHDVVPLYRTPDGSWSFREGSGEVVDYAVLMDRLPEDRLMDQLLDQNAVSPDQIRQIAHIMARFHKNSDQSDEILDAGSAENQREAILGNFELESAAGILDSGLFNAVRHFVETELDRLIAQLSDRARHGFIVDGHGDLHARNICLTEPPSIFDCIEFRPEFRCGDTATENAFLIMDLIYRGPPELAREYLETYIAETGDEEQRNLMPMLISYRAMVRAKVDAMAAADADIEADERERMRISANRHLQLAAASLLKNKTLVILVCGLPGTGKTFLCETLARRTGWTHLSSDRVRKELAGVAPEAKLAPEFYQPEFSQKTYAELEERVRAVLPNSPVLADANFRSKSMRAAFTPEADRAVVWVDCEDSVVRERMRKRARDDEAVSDADFAVYEKLKANFEPPGSEEQIPTLRIEGAGDEERSLNQILEWLLKNVGAKP